MRRMALFLSAVMVALVLASGAALAVSTIKGTPGDDNLKGTRFSDRMIGKNGDDRMDGRGGRDEMYGDRGADRMYGDSKNDEIYGGFFRDRLFGGSGRDYVQGDSGADYIKVAGDGIADSIDCGVGQDTAVVDEADVGQATVDEFFRLTSCENVIVR